MIFSKISNTALHGNLNYLCFIGFYLYYISLGIRLKDYAFIDGENSPQKYLNLME
jgi:hypothetical protein